MTPTISEAAVFAAAKAITGPLRDPTEWELEQFKCSLTAALPLLQGVNVAHGTSIGVLRIDDYGQFEEFECATDLKLPAGSYDLVIDLNEPSPRAQALEEAKTSAKDIGGLIDQYARAAFDQQGKGVPRYVWDVHFREFATALAALSQPVSPDLGVERPVEGGWLPIETAEKDVPILIFHHPENQWRGKIHIAYAHSDFNGHKHVITEDGPCGWIIHPKPTHWRPLPQAPGASA